MRHFRAQGFIPTAHWITLQVRKGIGGVTHLFKKYFALNADQTILETNLCRQDAFGCACKLDHFCKTISSSICVFKKLKHAQ